MSVCSLVIETYQMYLGDLWLKQFNTMVPNLFDQAVSDATAGAVLGAKTSLCTTQFFTPELFGFPV